MLYIYLPNRISLDFTRILYDALQVKLWCDFYPTARCARMNDEPRPGGDTAAPLNFEAQYKALSECVGSLESGRLSLDDSLAAYQKGIGLVQSCRNILAGAQAKVEKLIALDAQGQAQTEPLNLEVDTPDAMKPQTRKKAAKDDFF